MAAAGGWEPEPTFGDALAGPGGTSEPVQPNLFGGLTPTDIFPDALSGILVADVAADVALPVAAPVAAAASGTGRSGGRPTPGRRPTVATGQQVPQRSWSGAVRPAPGSPGRPAPAGVPVATQPWSPIPPAGPPGRYAAVPGIPTVAPSSRRPTAGIGYVPVAPSSGPAGLIRPPAYLPQGLGLAQVRAALRQARQGMVTRSRTTAEATRRRGSGLWGVLIALLIVLVVTGLAGKIITAISHVLQGM